MKEIDKLFIATAIVNEWLGENCREHDNEKPDDYTEAIRSVGAMHALSALFAMRGEDATPQPESFFNMFVKGIANAQKKTETDINNDPSTST